MAQDPASTETVSGDKISLDYSPCACGNKGPSIRDNIARFRAHCGAGVAILAVLKAWAYGTELARLATALQDSGIDARIILQVHDELVLEVREGLVEEVGAKIRKLMGGAAQLDVLPKK